MQDPKLCDKKNQKNYTIEELAMFWGKAQKPSLQVFVAETTVKLQFAVLLPHFHFVLFLYSTLQLKIMDCNNLPNSIVAQTDHITLLV